MKTLTKFVIFSFAMIILMTIACLVLKACTTLDFSVEYGIFCGVFASEVLYCALLKLLKIKKEE